MCDCKVGPGKFEGEPALTFLAWDAMMDGSSDATTGDSERGTLTEWLRGPGPFGFSSDSVDAAREYGYCDPCILAALATPAAGIELWESEQGFVYGREFATLEDFEASLAEAEAEDAGPEVHVFEQTASEVAAQDEDAVWEYLKRPEFRLATMNGRDRERMLDAMVAELGITGGWYYRISDDGVNDGPFETRREAQTAADRAAGEWS